MVENRGNSCRKLVKLASAGLISLANLLGTALASGPNNTVVAPQLIPYTINALAGNTQSNSAGFGGEGGPGLSATLNTPYALAVDSVGNVYWSETGSVIIRELNAQTGIVRIVAGAAPTSCSGTVCTKTSPGCADGVPAAGNGTGTQIQGIALDGYGNLYFEDSTYQGVWVIYKGGAQVANFITFEDPTGVATAGGVLPGYVYHIAGTAASAVGGCTTSFGSTDHVLATSALLHAPHRLNIDAAGNIYILDSGNSVIRVINAQATAQTFYGVTLPPGFIGSIVLCNANLTTACPATEVASLGGPAGQAFVGSVVSFSADQYGNVYANNAASAYTDYIGAAYSGAPGDSALAQMINVEYPFGSGYVAYAVVPGDWYPVGGSVGQATMGNSGVTSNGTMAFAVYDNESEDQPVLRGAGMATDPYGNLWNDDYHFGIIYRNDVNSAISTFLTGAHTPAFGTLTTPVFCYSPNFGVKNLTYGPMTYDAYGDGCNSTAARIGTSGNNQPNFDQLGNIYWTDVSYELIRTVNVNTTYKPLAVGSTLNQVVQLHFDPSNLPQMPAGYVSTATQTALAGGLQIISPTNDFSLLPATTTPPNSNYPSPTVCANNTSGLDTSLDCWINVVFSPQGPGMRNAILQIATASSTQNGKTYPSAVYNYALNGVGNGPQVAIDGGSKTVLYAGLGSTYAPLSGTPSKGPAGIALSPTGNFYVADTLNNQIQVLSPTGSLVGGLLPLVSGVPTLPDGTTLSGPKGVAVDAANNVYIADTGNNRVVKVVTANSPALTDTVLLPYPTSWENTPSAPATPIALSGPQGLAVDTLGNVYVADTGNKRVVKISSWQYYGAVPLLAYSGAQTFVSPVAVAVDSANNVYVADSGNTTGIVKIAAGGGDLQPAAGTTALPSPSTLMSFGSVVVGSPSGIAVDAAGDLYVSDGAKNNVVFFSASTGSFALAFTGLVSPAGLVLDSVGDVYVVDAGPVPYPVPTTTTSGDTARVVEEARASPTLSFGSASAHVKRGGLPVRLSRIETGAKPPVAGENGGQ